MKDPHSDDEAEDDVAPVDSKPAELTPEGLALMKRARRSFGLSIGLLLLGFMAIGAALVYRATRDAPPPPETATLYQSDNLELPAGAEVLSAVAADGMVSVTYRVGTVTQLRIFDGESGEMTRQMDIVTP